MKRYIQYEKLVVQNRSKAEEIARRAKELARYQVFKNQLSSEVASIALSDPKNLAKRYANIVTIVFDIKDSTNRSFSLNLQDYDHVVKETVEIFAQACSRAHITVDKYIGDGVQAFVGAPVAMSIEKGIFSALRAISDAKSELDARRDELEAFWQRRLQVKFSITVGEALVGFHGKSAIQNYTATGPYVSLAHRLCGLASEDEIAFHASDESLVPRDLLRCESFGTSSIKGLDEIRSLESGLVEQEAREIRVFKIPVDFVKPEKNIESIGDCAKCSRPLYLSESPTGLPKAYSTECESAKCQYSIDGLTRIFVKTSDAAS
jgi:adenylate cyclase